MTPIRLGAPRASLAAQVVWSEDGAQLAFTIVSDPTIQEDDAGIWIVDATGGNAHEVMGHVSYAPGWGLDW